MSAASLTVEYEAALHKTSFADLTPVRDAGVGGPGLAVGPALATISLDGSLWHPDPDGGRAFIIPVRNAASPESTDPVQAIREGEIIDLVAFSPAFPNRWALRTGIATWLGAIAPQFLMPDPVPMWRTPLHWLGNECRGLVLLSRDRRDQYRALICCDSILAEDERHAADLNRLLRHPWLVPPVYLRGAREVRNAA